ncbi:MAG: DUF2846 domain-containing protein [Candidatus Sulfotelmatobacter sp.]
MRSVLAPVLLAVSAFAQEQPGAVAAACGPKEPYEVKLDQSQHALARPETGKARVYFIQDIGVVNCLGACGTKIGLDGAWVGANKQNSYFSVSVEPGEHHVCANLSPHFSPSTVAVAHFTAEAGKVYYFRTRPFWAKDQLLNIDPVDSDEAKYLIESYPLSVSQPKR